MTKNLFRTALLAGGALAIATPARADQWGSYHWATNGSGLTVRVNASIISVWNPSVTQAVSDWNTPVISGVVDELALSQVPTSLDPKRCSPVVGQILVCNYFYGRRGWLGIATIWANGSHITQATTKLNDSYFSSGSYNQPKWREMVSCQEIGHDFGLAHQDENFNNVNLGSCMDYTNDPDAPGTNGPNNRHPNSVDYLSLQSAGMYGHSDGTTTSSGAATTTNFGVREVGKAAPHPDAPSGDGVADWGIAVHRDARGRADVFVRALGAGRKALTHVFWAPDATGHEAD